MSRLQTRPWLIVVVVALLGLAIQYVAYSLTIDLFPSVSGLQLAVVIYLAVYFLVGYVVSSRVAAHHLAWAAIAGLTVGLLTIVLTIVTYILIHHVDALFIPLLFKLILAVLGVVIALLGGWVAWRGAGLRTPDVPRGA